MKIDAITGGGTFGATEKDDIKFHSFIRIGWTIFSFLQKKKIFKNKRKIKILKLNQQTKNNWKKIKFYLTKRSKNKLIKTFSSKICLNIK